LKFYGLKTIKHILFRYSAFLWRCPRGAVESLEAVIDLLPHALQLLSGDTEHS